jgi:hypothetical protein
MTSRVKGPTDGPPPVDQAGEVDAPDAIAAPGDVAPVAGVGKPAGVALPDAITQVAARLRAGQITVDQAVDELIDDAIRRQVGRAVEDARDLAPQLRELLKGFATSDPFLAAKIRRLTLGK